MIYLADCSQCVVSGQRSVVRGQGPVACVLRSLWWPSWKWERPGQPRSALMVSWLLWASRPGSLWCWLPPASSCGVASETGLLPSTISGKTCLGVFVCVCVPLSVCVWMCVYTFLCVCLCAWERERVWVCDLLFCLHIFLHLVLHYSICLFIHLFANVCPFVLQIALVSQNLKCLHFTVYNVESLFFWCAPIASAASPCWTSGCVQCRNTLLVCRFS